MTLHFYLARNRTTFEEHMTDRGAATSPMSRNVHRLIEEPQDAVGIKATNCQLHLLHGWQSNPMLERNPQVVERLRMEFPKVFLG
ncbi:hypothetical protein LCGC14_1559960 [marine sediment metagenome]|uniref:Uncharacterized protein n=1 Tax=marine sediment metagenome TaxID=412755 RepID=A0A0F9LNI3_9ZZZZ